jgi:hypothetical protein
MSLKWQVVDLVKGTRVLPGDVEVSKTSHAVLELLPN